MVKIDKIIIKGMDIFAYHGVLDAEKILGQHFIFDIKIYHNLALSGKSDLLENSISYAEVYSTVEKVVKSNSFNLIESLAEKCAETVILKFGAEKVKIKIKKPQAPINGNFEYCGVEIKRKKSDYIK